MNIDLQLGNLFHNCSQNLKQARILDNLPIDQRGPLHGIPFSVKEHFHFKGRDSTAGLYQLIGQTAKQNAQIGTYFLGNFYLIMNFKYTFYLLPLQLNYLSS